MQLKNIYTKKLISKSNIGYTSWYDASYKADRDGLFAKAIKFSLERKSDIFLNNLNRAFIVLILILIEIAVWTDICVTGRLGFDYN